MDEQGADCPSWCVSEHESPEPRGGHHGVPRTVAVILGRRRPDSPGHDPEPGELVVVVSQRPFDHEPWVEIVEPEHSERALRLSPESVRRLIGAIDPATGLPR